MDNKLGRYRISKPIETASSEGGNPPIYTVRINVIDNFSGKIVREFMASDSDDIQAALRAVDKMMAWLKDGPA